jgi:lactate dehydrogenase-like 2-hydroxyacid dehydrogenase
MDNMILMLHLATSSGEAMRRMVVQVAEGVMTVLRGGAPESLVVI